MSQNKESFLHEVLQYIKSKEARILVNKELSYHLNISKKELITQGMSEHEAEKIAVKQMGNPTELGTHFNKLYRPRTDWTLLTLFITIILMSLLPILSVQDQNDENLLMKQTIYIVLGTVFALGAMFVDYRKIEKLGLFFLAVGFVLLLALNFTPNVIINGVGYIKMAGFTISSTNTIPFFLMFWASYFSKEKPNLLVSLGIFLLPLFLYMSMPNLKDVLIYGGLTLTLFCYSTINRKSIYTTIGVALTMFLTFLTLFWFSAAEYQKIRILAFLHPEDYAQNAGFMYIRVQELITGGGWFGNQTMPKYVPTITTDMAFANITYFYGWILAGFLFVLLLLLLARMVMVSGQIKDRFGKQLVIGVCSYIAIQCFYNIGMVLGFLPLIAISLPFVSYGMTPTVINSLLIGVTLSVYRRKNLVVLKKT
jgi:cell division protein FtsW (lipid II flippase)